MKLKFYKNQHFNLTAMKDLNMDCRLDTFWWPHKYWCRKRFLKFVESRLWIFRLVICVFACNTCYIKNPSYRSSDHISTEAKEGQFTVDHRVVYRGKRKLVFTVLNIWWRTYKTVLLDNEYIKQIPSVKAFQTDSRRKWCRYVLKAFQNSDAFPGCLQEITNRNMISVV